MTMRAKAGGRTSRGNGESEIKRESEADLRLLSQAGVGSNPDLAGQLWVSYSIPLRICFFNCKNRMMIIIHNGRFYETRMRIHW